MTTSDNLAEYRNKLDVLLAAVAKLGGSDLHLRSDASPSIRVNGKLKKLDTPPLEEKIVRNLILSSMTTDMRETYVRDNDADYAIVSPHGRFRASAYLTRQKPAMVARLLSENPKSLDELSVPPKVGMLAESLNGLILVTGATGSGKTTTLAGIIDQINRTREVKILTIEDPIEIIHTDKRASIDQREVFSDTPSFNKALRQGLRQDPDVILVGELRDYETARVALHAAETGHLVLSTLHTNSAADTISRFIKMFPSQEEPQIRLALSDTLRGVVCQRLVPTIDKRRTPVVEIMSGEGRIPDAIAEPHRVDIEEVIANDTTYGMQTFEAHLVELVARGIVTEEEATKVSLNAHDLKVRLRQLRNRR